MTIRQPSLFDIPAEPEAPRPPNLDNIRKHLRDMLRTVRNAEIMPWNNADARHWEQNFPVLARMLPHEEGDPMIAEFEKEMSRLKAARV